MVAHLSNSPDFVHVPFEKIMAEQELRDVSGRCLLDASPPISVGGFDFTLPHKSLHAVGGVVVEGGGGDGKQAFEVWFVQQTRQEERARLRSNV